jgi:hypothetical protein
MDRITIPGWSSRARDLAPTLGSADERSGKRPVVSAYGSLVHQGARLPA